MLTFHPERAVRLVSSCHGVDMRRPTCEVCIEGTGKTASAGPYLDQALDPGASDRARACDTRMTNMIPAWVNGTLAPVEKLEAHVKGLRHKAVSVFLLRGDKVLLQQRALGKYHTPGLWANTCCTHPHWGETALDCATRRLEQELGLDGIPLIFRDTVEYRAEVGGGLIEHEVVDIFVGELPEGREPAPDPVEVMDTIWHPLAELKRDVIGNPKGFTPWLQIYLRDHAAVIFLDA